MEIDGLKSIKSLDRKYLAYKFLGVLENYKQEDKLVLENASKEYFLPSLGDRRNNAVIL